MTATETDLALVGRVTLTATLRVRTGLHIGAGKDSIEIGGIDNPVVKTPYGDPYIPGSSIKGRMRFLLEWAFNKLDLKDGKPWGMNPRVQYEAGDPVLRLFGTPAKREQWSGGPTRLLVRDAMPTPEWRDGLLSRGLALTESKTEVSIDRVAGKARDGGLHTAERVPPGAAFAFEAVCRLYRVDGDEGRDRDCLAWAIHGLDLIEQDALGGSGSRGYGRVAFEGLTLAGPGGRAVALDNRFRGHAFSPEGPPADLRAAVDEALGG